MRSWQALGFASFVVFMGWGISREESPQRLDPNAGRGQDFAPLARSKETIAQSEAKMMAELSGRSPQAITIPEKNWPERPFQYQSDLDAFARIKAKVFLNEAEEAEQRRLLNDSSLLKALGLRLTEASLAPSVTASQDAAVDLLVEAMKNGDKALAAEIARAVIEDPQVENTSIERSVRENLAGVKAEVLYHWAALMPEEAGAIERYLPGPVSQKIWANVARRHSSNRAESQQEFSQRR